MTVRVLESLDEVLGVGADALVTTARRRRLLNGVAVGVLRDGECLVRLFGATIGLESRFEIGSVTKTYTAELLAILVARGTVKLDDPVGKYLLRASPQDCGPDAITLEDLATHRSGLPRLPLGVPALSLNPYARYSAQKLERYVARRGLKRGPEPNFLYSNLGYSLLGYALGNAAGTPYAQLLRRELLEPLAMTETELARGQSQPALVRGHMQSGLPAIHWDFDVCAPCGGLCSTVSDQLKWLSWLLEDTDRASFQPRADAGAGRIGLAWLMPPQGESRRHHGATFGFSSWISLDRARRSGVVILSNRMAPRLVDTLGVQFERCLKGVRPGELGSDYGRGFALVRDPIQVVAAPLSPMLSPILSPIVGWPFWLRLPAAAAIIFALAQLLEWIGSGLRAGWLAR